MFWNVNYEDPVQCFQSSVDSFRQADFRQFLFWVLAVAHVLKWFGSNDIELINDHTKKLRDVLVPHIQGGGSATKARLAQAARYVTLKAHRKDCPNTVALMLSASAQEMSRSNLAHTLRCADTPIHICAALIHQYISTQLSHLYMFNSCFLVIFMHACPGPTLTPTRLANRSGTLTQT